MCTCRNVPRMSNTKTETTLWKLTLSNHRLCGQLIASSICPSDDFGPHGIPQYIILLTFRWNSKSFGHTSQWKKRHIFWPISWPLTYCRNTNDFPAFFLGYLSYVTQICPSRVENRTYLNNFYHNVPHTDFNEMKDLFRPEQFRTPHLGTV